jgi:hypothetical protein
MRYELGASGRKGCLWKDEEYHLGKEWKSKAKRCQGIYGHIFLQKWEHGIHKNWYNMEEGMGLSR